jgi:hypothetical protein
MGCGCNNNFNGKKMKKNSRTMKKNVSKFKGDSIFSRNGNKQEVFANLSGFNRSTHDRNFGAKINRTDLMGF